MFYDYPSHYLYDLILITSNLIMVKQFFGLSMNKIQLALFATWMMVFYQINFYIILPNFPREYKYLTLLVGFFLAYMIIVKLNYISSLIIVMISVLFNGIWTNINLYFMLRFIFPNYGLALDAKHLQYTCYIITVIIITGLLKLSKIKIVEIERYS